VLECESTAEFQAWRTGAEVRKDGAAQAVTTKTRKLLAYVEQVKIVVPIVEEEMLLAAAIDSYNAWTRNNSRDFVSDDASSDPEFLERITVNYLRHELTCYEDQLSELYGRVGIEAALDALREKIYDAISEAHPHLTDECDRQLSRRKGLEPRL
jgi:hypothetical protein